MKNMLLALSVLILLSMPLAATADYQYGDFTYRPIFGGQIITGYTGSGGDVAIPDAIYGLPVVTIGNQAFQVKAVSSVFLPAHVKTIQAGAFAGCSLLTNLAPVPSSLISIDVGAFGGCTGLREVLFRGNAPSADTGDVFPNTAVTVYYLPGAIGWGTTFSGRPAVLWNPLMQSSGVGPAGFGFNVTGTADIPLVIEAATNLAGASWVPLQSLNLTNGMFHFSDPKWTNYPARLYRIRSP